MAKRSALCALDEPTPTARTLIEHTYAQLRDDIVTGRLLPGEKLRTYDPNWFRLFFLENGNFDRRSGLSQ